MTAVKKTEDKLAGAKAQGQAQFESIKEMIANLDGWRDALEEAGWEEVKDKFGAWCWRDKADGATWAGTPEDTCLAHAIEPMNAQREAGRRAIEEDALSVQVRSGWYSPGTAGEEQKAAEYEILLCTGGPACRIIGQLNQYCEPETAVMQVQDWFQPWADYRPKVSADNYDAEPVLLAYARVFWFGE